MSLRGALFLAPVIALIASTAVATQSQKLVTGVSTFRDAASRASAVPRTADGHPDLQGLWDFAQRTPFERPGDFA
jgi:hypothetical protein